MFAFNDAYRSGLFSSKHWTRNILSGLIVGVVALPLAMAFAIASGVKPEQGIYTSIVAAIIVAIFGGSRVQIAGPTGAFIVILAGIVQQYGITGLQIATVMAGGILLLLGLSKLGGIIHFIPDPVIVGFTSGIGVIIWVGQWKEFFGLPAVHGEHFHQKLIQLIEFLPHFDSSTTLLSLFALSILIISPRIPYLRLVPAPLVALITTTLLSITLPDAHIRTIGSAFGGIPQGLPTLSIPAITFTQVIQLIGPAFAIAMLGAIESLLSAVVADGMTGTKHDSNKELIGQGIANIVTPMFGGIAATGAIARTATNIKNGGNSPISAIIHSIFLILVIVLLAPLAIHIPLATLSAILFVVAWNMSEMPHFIQIIKRAPTADVVILLTTFCLTVFADLVVAVNIGVILAAFQFVKRMATSVEVRPSSQDELSPELEKHGLSKLPNDISVYALDGPFFYAAAETFERVMNSISHTPNILIIRLKWVPFVDITALQSLEEIITAFQRKGVTVMISGANSRVDMKLHRAKIIEQIGELNYFLTFNQALESALSHHLNSQNALKE